MKIKEIIKYQWKSKENKTLQQKALKILGYFLVLMFILTILSRFADSLLIPIVKTETLKGMTITHEVEANGSIIQNREEGIDVIENLKVSHVNVYPGSEIKEGDTLFEIDLTDLKSQIQQVENEISEKEKNLSRATEDYNLAVSRQDKIISDALDAYKEAENLVNKYNNASEEEKQSLDKEAIEYDYNLKKTAYNQAVNDKSSNLLMEKRALEDVKEASNTDELKKKLENLKKIEGAEGKFVSEKEGIVTNVAVVAGDVTSAGSAVYLADKESGYKFVAELSKDLKKYAKQGQSVVLKIGNSNNEIGDLTIDSISKGEDDNYKVSVLLPTGVGEIGDGGNLTLSSKSKKYQVCVPLEALHQEGQDKYYILVVGEEDTLLGTEKVAVRVDVSIADKNDTYAALTEGTISNSQKIIVSSNKTIKEGDRVRLEEE